VVEEGVGAAGKFVEGASGSEGGGTVAEAACTGDGRGGVGGAVEKDGGRKRGGAKGVERGKASPCVAKQVFAEALRGGVGDGVAENEKGGAWGGSGGRA
jgi:hypothetical protein